MEEPSTFAMWTLVLSSVIYGALMIMLVLFILKTRGSQKQYIATYADEVKFEDGPLLELPKGVVPASKFKKFVKEDNHIKKTTGKGFFG